MTTNRHFISWWKITGLSLACWWWKGSFSSTSWPGGLSAEGAGETDQRKGFCMLVLAGSPGKLLWAELSSIWPPAAHTASSASSSSGHGSQKQPVGKQLAWWFCSRRPLAPAVSGSPQYTDQAACLSNHHTTHLPHSQQFWNEAPCCHL